MDEVEVMNMNPEEVDLHLIRTVSLMQLEVLVTTMVQ